MDALWREIARDAAAATGALAAQLLLVRPEWPGGPGEPGA